MFFDKKVCAECDHGFYMTDAFAEPLTMDNFWGCKPWLPASECKKYGLDNCKGCSVVHHPEAKTSTG